MTLLLPRRHRRRYDNLAPTEDDRIRAIRECLRQGHECKLDDARRRRRGMRDRRSVV